MKCSSSSGLFNVKGREQWFEYHITPVRDDNGDVNGVFLSTTDITERKQAEDELRQSEEKFATAFQTASYAVTIARTSDGKFIAVNDAFTAITGISQEEALASSAIGLKLWVHEEDHQRVGTDLGAGHTVAAQEFLFRKKNGEILTGLFSAQTILLGGGELCVFVQHQRYHRAQTGRK